MARLAGGKRCVFDWIRVLQGVMYYVAAGVEETTLPETAD